ncbi:histidine triad (HIT) [Chlorella sorokiniana]|uniref:Histidine triad (HIT) n=1 Tax=Chlorella sorokiniana TaxID=3076 RepID=A0A2P6TMT8_CHLSO|nr:histidine triad (HIT) [Chlorella sorokiniana]|eukprot:PRW45654.1 histidine triad (HIT) [Chlorella sorokiniana]
MALGQLAAACAGLAAGWLLGRHRRRQRSRGAEVFDVDPRLVQGKHEVCELPLCKVLLCDDVQYPCWLVLVPRVNRVREVIELSEEQQASLWREVDAAARVIQDLYRPLKLNIAAIGNIVSQLHVHITARLQTDPAWPGPCYGAVPAVPLAPEQLAAALAMLRDAFANIKLPLSKSAWAATSLRSGFGDQPLSNRASAPAAGFGSSSRDAYGKQDTISKQVLSTVASPPRMRFGTSKRPGMAEKTDAPGPGAYKIKPALGSTVESTRASAPSVKFGSGSRDQANRLFISAEHEKCQVGVDSPGPSYTIPAALGKQQLSTKKSAGAFVMPRGQRFVDNDVREAAQKPGAGAYTVPSTIGGSPVKRNSPTVKFGSGTRDQANRLFISAEHEKGSFGTCSPGPVTANPASSMGRQVQSSKSSAGSIGFGTGKRLADHASDVPGPGAYYA